MCQTQYVIVKNIITLTIPYHFHMQVGPEMFFEFINMTPCPSPAIFTFENKMAFDGVC